jgi:hypothetical protein
VEQVRVASASSTRKVPYERLPYPLGYCWVCAHRTDNLQVVNKAAETAVRAIFAMVLADVLDLDWPQREGAILSGESDNADLSRLPFGTCVHLLRTAVKVHAGAPDRVLPDLQSWWAHADGSIGDIVRQRNKETHGHQLTESTPDEARTRFATFLRDALWLQTVQLVYVRRSRKSPNADGKYRGTVVRLRGAKPFDEPKNLLDPVGWQVELDEHRVYLGRADATVWTMHPFVHVDDQSISTLTAIDRNGRLQLGDPADARGSESLSVAGIAKPEDGSQLAWPEFLKVRQEIAPQFRQSQAARFDKLRLETPVDQLLTKGKKVGEFLLLQLLGQGGFATVWEVEDTVTGEICALKILLPAVADRDHDARRFELEINRLRKLWACKCRRILGPVEAHRIQFGDELRLLLKMPLLHGTLEELARERRHAGDPVSVLEVVQWAVQCLQGLTDMHAHGVVHRDIKPSNLLIDGSDQIVIADLGIARDESTDSGLTGTNVGLGSGPYMAPEQLSNAKNATGKADVYALAITLHELLTGARHPAAGRGLAAPIGPLLLRMGALHADDRPTAAEAEAEFAAILAELQPVVVTQAVVPESKGLQRYRAKLREFLLADGGVTAARAEVLTELAGVFDLSEAACSAVKAELEGEDKVAAAMQARAERQRAADQAEAERVLAARAALERADAARAKEVQGEADSKRKAEHAAAQTAERKRQKAERQAEAERKNQEAIAERKRFETAEAERLKGLADAALAEAQRAAADWARKEKQKADAAAAAERGRQAAEEAAAAAAARTEKEEAKLQAKRKLEAEHTARADRLARERALALEKKAEAERQRRLVSNQAEGQRLAFESARMAERIKLVEMLRVKAEAARKAEGAKLFEAERVSAETTLIAERTKFVETLRFRADAARIAEEGECLNSDWVATKSAIEKTRLREWTATTKAQQVMRHVAEKVEAVESESKVEAGADALATDQPRDNHERNALRLRLLSGDRVIEDRIYSDSTQVSIGSARNSTIVLPEEGYRGPSLAFQSRKDGSLSMRAPADMQIQLAIDGAPIDLKHLQVIGKAGQVGDDLVVELSLGTRGRAIIGQFVLLFQAGKRPEGVAPVESERLAVSKLATGEYSAVVEASNRLVALTRAIAGPAYSPSTSARGAIARPQRLTVPLTAVNGKFGITFRDLMGLCCVKEVVPGGAAALAGISAGDVLTEFDGVPLSCCTPKMVVGWLVERSSHVLSLWRGLYHSVADDEVRHRYHSTAYHVDGDGTIWDPTLQLTWQQAHSEQDLQWVEASAYATNLRLGGHRDWRLPTIFEILSLVDPSRPLGDRIRSGFQNSAGWFWSSSPYRGSRDLVLQVDFWSGDFCYFDRSCRVRCVR